MNSLAVGFILGFALGTLITYLWHLEAIEDYKHKQFLRKTAHPDDPEPLNTNSDWEPPHQK